jgi:hypothetical protein
MAFNPRLSILAILILFVSLSFLAVISVSVVEADNGSSGEQTAKITESGFCANPSSDQSGAVWEKAFPMSDMVITSVELKLTWTDDEGSDSDPDSFSLKFEDGVNPAKSSTGSNSQGGPGEITLTAEGSEFGTDWNVTVECTEAGNTPVGRLGLLVYVDAGNNWDLEITYTYIPVTEISMEFGGPPPHMVELLNSPGFKVHLIMMISSTYLFAVTGIIAGVYLITRLNNPVSRFINGTPALGVFTRTKLFLAVGLLCLIMFFIAAVPIGMWVAGKAYGWSMMWSGMPTIWNEEAWSITNADNTALIALIIFGIPFYFNRKIIYNRISFLKPRAARAPSPLLSDKDLGIYFMLSGLLIFFMFMVQPHG